MPQTSDPALLENASVWWGKRRFRCNVTLVGSIIVSGPSYVAILAHFCDVIGRPIIDAGGRVVGHEAVDVAGIEGIVQCCGVVVAIGLANIFYFLGAAVERGLDEFSVAVENLNIGAALMDI